MIKAKQIEQTQHIQNDRTVILAGLFRLWRRRFGQTLYKTGLRPAVRCGHRTLQCICWVDYRKIRARATRLWVSTSPLPSPKFRLGADNFAGCPSRGRLQSDKDGQSKNCPMPDAFLVGYTEERAKCSKPKRIGQRVAIQKKPKGSKKNPMGSK